MCGITTQVVRVAPGENIKVTPLLGAPQIRRVIRQHGVGGVSRASVHNHNSTNIMRGLRERVFAVEGPHGLTPPPRPVAGAYEDRCSEFRSLVVQRCRGVIPVTYEAFLSKYSGKKFARYSKAIENIRLYGWEVILPSLTGFVKAEFVNQDLKPDPAPRMIQFRTAEFGAALGRYVQPLEHRLYRAIGKIYGSPVVMKGYNAEQIARILVDKWNRFEKPVAVGMDASRFDQHVSVDCLKWEHSTYLSCFNKPHELARLLEGQLVNSGKCMSADAIIKYKVRGNRMSGDMNTALGNCLIMCGLVYTYCGSKGIHHDLIDNGDDATVIIEQKDLSSFMSGLKEWFLEMGFTMKVEEPVYILEHIEFCQTKPVQTALGWTMCRNPWVCISKDTLWKYPNFGPGFAKCYSSWCNAVGLCGSSMSAGIPVMEAFYGYMSRYTRETRKQVVGDGWSGLELMSQGLCRQACDITPEARVSFWEAFGILPDHQSALEEYYTQRAPDCRVRQSISGDSEVELQLLLSHNARS